MAGMVIRAMASMPRSARSCPAIAPQFASVRRSPASFTFSRIASPMTTTGIPDLSVRSLRSPLSRLPHTDDSNDPHQFSPS
jgi:hypothetical protein